MKKTENKTKKEIRYEYWFAYIDNNNKVQNALADCHYLINSRERMLQEQEDIRRYANGNFRCFLNF